MKFFWGLLGALAGLLGAGIGKSLIMGWRTNKIEMSTIMLGVCLLVVVFYLCKNRHTVKKILVNTIAYTTISIKKLIRILVGIPKNFISSIKNKIEEIEKQ